MPQLVLLIPDAYPALSLPRGCKRNAVAPDTCLCSRQKEGRRGVEPAMPIPLIGKVNVWVSSTYFRSLARSGHRPPLVGREVGKSKNRTAMGHYLVPGM